MITAKCDIVLLFRDIEHILHIMGVTHVCNRKLYIINGYTKNNVDQYMFSGHNTRINLVRTAMSTHAQYMYVPTIKIYSIYFNSGDLYIVLCGQFIFHNSHSK